MKTRVLITIDTEFTIAGAFENEALEPVGSDNVFCPVNGKSQGLDFILQTLDNCGLRACFFVEALNRYYFGDQTMADVAHGICRRGHEIQLHLHPVWYQFRDPQWRVNLSRNPPNDDCATKSKQELTTIIGDGMDIFQRWGLAKPTVLRTGGLRVNEAVYAAMAELTMPMASNIGLGVFKPSEPNLQLYGGCHNIHGVLEFPILSYREAIPGLPPRFKTLTITGSSWSEIRYLLRQARQQQLQTVVILSHPFEFIKNQDNQLHHARRNRINQHRFIKLCRFLADNQDHYETCVFKDLAAHCQNNGQNRPLRVPAGLSLGRALENKLNAFSWT